MHMINNVEFTIVFPTAQDVESSERLQLVYDALQSLSDQGIIQDFNMSGCKEE